MSLMARVLRRIRITEDGCWLWQGSATASGYGQITVRQPDGTWAPQVVHKAVWEHVVGPVPAGEVLDHLTSLSGRCAQGHDPSDTVVRPNGRRRCRVCDRAYAAVRNAERPRKGRPHPLSCKRGHPFDEANTYHHRGRRICRACRDAAQREARAAA